MSTDVIRPGVNRTMYVDSPRSVTDSIIFVLYSQAQEM